MIKRISNKSTHMITSRQKGQADRILVLLGIAIFLLMIVCSIYALVLAPTNPAAWVMIVFFLVGLLIILGREENVFPDLRGKKLSLSLVIWLFALIFIAYLVSFLMNMNFQHLVIALVFGLIVALGAGFIFSTEKQWSTFKVKAKSSTGGRIKKAVGKTKTGKKLEARKKRRMQKKAARKKTRRIKGW